MIRMHLTAAASTEDRDTRRDEAAAVAAQLMDDALTDARISSKEAGFLCGVSDSLVNRWRSPLCRESPSFVQLLLLPPSFHIALHRRMNAHYRYDRAAVVRILEDIGSLAVLNGV